MFFLILMQNQLRALFSYHPNTIWTSSYMFAVYMWYLGLFGCIFCSLSVSSVKNGWFKQKHVPGWECFSLLFTDSYKLKFMSMPVIFLLFLVIFTTVYSIIAPWHWKYLNVPRLIFLVILCFSRNTLCMKVWVGHCRQLLIQRNMKLL